MALKLFLLLFYLALTVADHHEEHIKIAANSEYNGHGRNGISGWKCDSKTPSQNFGTEDFRSPWVFGSVNGTDSQVSDFSLLPNYDYIYFERRTYAWSALEATQNDTFHIICKYRFGPDDGKVLSSLKFSNGTRATALFFGCSFLHTCCGMYCCFNETILFAIVFIVAMMFLSYRFVKWYSHYRHKVIYGGSRARFSLKDTTSS